jgi:transcriptional regulator with XRE-family HTH domain
VTTFAQRLDRGLSQEALARLLNVAHNTVNRWEMGKCEPTLETMRKVAGVLGVDITDRIT